MIKKILLVLAISLVSNASGVKSTAPLSSSQCKVGQSGESIPCGIKDLHLSINKIVVFSKKGVYVATVFAVNYNSQKYIVTNNHVCHGFYGAAGAYLAPTGIEQLPNAPIEAFQMGLDQVTGYYMHPGTDICIIKSQKDYQGLSLNETTAMPTDDILIAGFVGRSLDLMYVDGKVYGTMIKDFPDELRSCMFNTPREPSNKVTCEFFTDYPTYKRRRLQVGVNNIGPGFSGSPVLKDGKVVGIVSMYFTPNTGSGYYNGDVIFFPVTDIIDVIKESKGHMIAITAKDYKNRNEIYEFDENIREFYYEVENEMSKIIRELLKKDE